MVAPLEGVGGGAWRASNRRNCRRSSSACCGKRAAYSWAVGRSPSSARSSASLSIRSTASSALSAITGKRSKYNSAPARSPRPQRRRWSARRTDSQLRRSRWLISSLNRCHDAGSPPGVESRSGSKGASLILGLLPSHRLQCAVDRPIVLLADRVGDQDEASGDLGPRLSRGTQLGDRTGIGSELVEQALQQIAAFHHRGGITAWVDDLGQ